MPNQRRNCCGCQNKRQSQESCCEAIVKAMGKYFLESGQLVDAKIFNATFTDGELIARTQSFEKFLIAYNALVRSAFEKLNACMDTKCDTGCCAGAAEAISNAAIGYVNLAFQSALSSGNPLVAPDPNPFEFVTLSQVLGSISLGSISTFNAILSTAGCSQQLPVPL
jgi:hypothetical protein